MNFLFENWQKYLTNPKLLIEGRIDDAKKKYPHLAEVGIIDTLVANDPSDNQKYLMWAAKQIDYTIDDPNTWVTEYQSQRTQPGLADITAGHNTFKDLVDGWVEKNTINNLKK